MYKINTGGNDVQPEKLAAYEFRYERQQTKNLLLAGSLFYHDQDIVTAASGVDPVGNLKSWGVELEAIYRTSKATFTLSHGFTKQIKFQTPAGATPLSVNTSQRQRWAMETTLPTGATT